MSFNPVGQQYKPDSLSSGGATQKSFDEKAPKSGTGIITTLLRLAMRRMTAHGYAATKETSAIKPKDAVTIGSHGAIK